MAAAYDPASPVIAGPRVGDGALAISHNRRSARPNHASSTQPFHGQPNQPSTAPVASAATAATAQTTSGRPETVGVHDGAINNCDGNRTQTTDPGPKEYAAAASSFSNPNFGPLNVGTVRYIVPWDIAFQHNTTNAGKRLRVEQLCLDAWLVAANNYGLHPELDLGRQSNGAGGALPAPNFPTYREAVKAFLNTYTRCGQTCPLPAALPAPLGTTNDQMAPVRIIAPWNEPDGGGVGNPGAVEAARMWLAVSSRCTICTVIAGDFSGRAGNVGSPSYRFVYATHLNGQNPPVWGVHPYGDIFAIEQYKAGLGPKPDPTGTTVAKFASFLNGRGYHRGTHIWINEISTFYARYMETQAPYRPLWTHKVQGEAASYLLNTLGRPGGVTTPGEPFVNRVYYFNFVAVANGNNPNTRWALVVRHPVGNGDYGPGAPVQPLYNVFALRPNPQ